MAVLKIGKIEIGDLVDKEGEVEIECEDAEDFSYFYINQDDAKAIIEHLTFIFDI